MAIIRVELARSATDDVRALVGELTLELAPDYLPEQLHGLSVDELFQPRVRFCMASLDGAVVGCGGIVLHRDYAEVKRMYVRPAARGSGAAHAILARLEAQAREEGLSLLRLETGDRQRAAMRFYEREGFRRCAAFGAYVGMPEKAVAVSVFYEKRLS